ncbi:Rid family hydrolase [Kribbella sp. NPDC051770]|uniref:Rid family hydrolase n=1 Tax=Kribbella sp. NPDC051770 TaxID=3155413 RepID=UPI00343B7A23
MAVQTESFGVPWEHDYGYVQAVRRGDTIYLSGQLSHDGAEFVAPAPVGADGVVTDFSATADQWRRTYVNAEELLKRFGATLDDVVEEVVYVLDVDTAMSVAGEVRKAAYRRGDPQVASTILGVTRLALPQQLIEVKFVARV